MIFNKFLSKQLYNQIFRLDGKHVVFGSVVDGMNVVKEVEKLGSASGKTSTKIMVTNCGQL